MTQAFLEASQWTSPRGVVAATAGESPDAQLDFFRVGHPVPTDASVIAGRRALDFATSVTRDRLLLVLLSGGASAALAVPADGLTLDDKIAATQALLRAGVPIDVMNCVRKHLSAIKGGRLAAATPGAVLTLAISDVVGPVADDPTVIGSGPTVADPTTFGDALRVVQQPGVAESFPVSARQVLVEGVAGARRDTPPPGDRSLARSTTTVIGSRLHAMKAAAATAQDLGYQVEIVHEPVVGEASLVGASFLERVRRLASGRRGSVCVVSSGETTVKVRGPGRGGRNQELALACVEGLAGMTGEVGDELVLASIGTDGVDGPTDAAGAIVDGTTLARSRERGMAPPTLYLEHNDSYAFFDALGDLVRTGPTDTNVGDLQVVLVGHAQR